MQSVIGVSICMFDMSKATEIMCCSEKFTHVMVRSNQLPVTDELYHHSYGKRGVVGREWVADRP